MKKKASACRVKTFCTNCGALITDGSFCTVCGAPVRPAPKEAGTYSNAPGSTYNYAGAQNHAKTRNYPGANNYAGAQNYTGAQNYAGANNYAGAQKYAGTYNAPYGAGYPEGTPSRSANPPYNNAAAGMLQKGSSSFPPKKKATLKDKLMLAARILLSLLAVLLMIVFINLLLIKINGTDTITLAALYAFAESKAFGGFINSPLTAAAAGVIFAAAVAALVLFNKKDTAETFFWLSVVFTAGGIAVLVSMLAFSLKALHLIIAAGCVFAGAVFMFLYTFFLAYSKKTAKIPGIAP